MSSSNQFYVTRDLFREYIHYDGPLSYEDWCNLPQDHKAAALYVEFFDTITFVWYKIKASYSTEEDGVAEVLQYLDKNVPLIEANPTKYHEKYIYRVCFNCLDCLCQDPINKYRRWYENECSNLMSKSDGSDEMIDIFDYTAETPDLLRESKIDAIREHFWDVVDSLGVDAQAVVAELIGGDVKVDSKRKCWDRDSYQQRLHDSWNLEIEVPEVTNYPEKYDTEYKRNKYRAQQKREYIRREKEKFMTKKAPRGYDIYKDTDFNDISEEQKAVILTLLRTHLEKFKSAFGM